MNDRKQAARESRNIVTSGGSLALFGGSSVVTSGGGLVAQVTGHVGTAGLLGIYGSAALIAVVGGATAIIKIVAERSPEIRKARALAKIAEKRSGQDGGKLLILDRCLDQGEISTGQVLKVLNLLSALEEQYGGPEDTGKPLRAGKTGSYIFSIYARTGESIPQASLT